jgi:hypothetical protein
MIVTQKHPEDQACQAGGKYYGHNIPFPTDHSDECNEADQDGKQINCARISRVHWPAYLGD